jgi:hypothetical protein
MPITGSRASAFCHLCTHDRSECGECMHLGLDRRGYERRVRRPVERFVPRGQRELFTAGWWQLKDDSPSDDRRLDPVS